MLSGVEMLKDQSAGEDQRRGALAVAAVSGEDEHVRSDSAGKGEVDGRAARLERTGLDYSKLVRNCKEVILHKDKLALKKLFLALAKTITGY